MYDYLKIYYFLGKRQWTENDQYYFVKSEVGAGLVSKQQKLMPPPDCDTLSEISNLLDNEDERLPLDVIKALKGISLKEEELTKLSRELQQA